VTPGVYLVSANGPVDLATLPKQVGNLGFGEFHGPRADTVPPVVQSFAAPQYLADRESRFRVRLVEPTPADSVTLFVRPTAGGFFRGFPMRASSAYEYEASLPPGTLREGPHEFVVTRFRSGSALTFPGGVERLPWQWDYYGRDSWRFEAVAGRTPLTLFDPASDAARMAFTRIGDAGRRGLFRLAFSPVTGRTVFHFPLPVSDNGWSPPDYTASLAIVDRVRARGESISELDAVELRLRGLGARQSLHLTRMEDDGTSWSAAIPVDSAWSERVVPLADFAAGRGALLPQGFPGAWSYWVGPAAGRGGAGDRPRLNRVERLQLSLRREDGVTVTPESYGVEVEWVRLKSSRP
jgi:hypothetical protein